MVRPKTIANRDSFLHLFCLSTNQSGIREAQTVFYTNDMLQCFVCFPIPKVSEKKWATGQSFIRKEITTYRIGTLMLARVFLLSKGQMISE